MSIPSGRWVMGSLGPWTSRLVGLVSVAALIAALRLGRSLLIPVALSVLLTLVLAPLVNRVQRWGLSRLWAVILVVSMLLLSVGWMGWIVAGQIADVARKLPEYRDTVQKRLTALNGPITGFVGRASRAARDLARQFSGEPRTEEQGHPEKVRVEVSTPPSPLRLLGTAAGPLIQVLGALAVIAVLVIFLLLYQADARDRLIHLCGVSQIHVATRTVDEAVGNVGRYLLLLTVLNAAHGTMLGLFLAAVGLPNALLWGFVAAIFRYVPYVGPWIGAALPTALSLAVFEGWGRPLLVVGGMVGTELISNLVLEPWIYGRRTGLSPLAVIVSAIFWAWLWGGIGLILAIPLTVCLVALGRHVPRLRFLNTLLGRDPGLEPSLRLYQRLLAGDAEEAAELLDRSLRTKPLPEVLDTLVLPALRLAEQDRHQGLLEEDRAVQLRRILREQFEELCEESHPPSTGDAPTVACLPVSDEADELAALFLSQALAAGGYRTVWVPSEATAGEKVDRVEAAHAELICLSAIPPGAILPSRYLYKRLRRRFPDLEIILGLWGTPPEALESGERVAADGRIHPARSVSEAVECVRRLTVLHARPRGG